MILIVTPNPALDLTYTVPELRPHSSHRVTEAAAQAGGKQVSAKVSEMRGLGDFATWRAARAAGDHDLNTFAVRADPVDAAPGLEPGVTVWISGR